MAKPTQEILDDENMTDWQQAMLFQNIQRTKLSNERNLLNWIRTSVAFMTLGFVIERFHLVLKGLGADSTVAASPLMRFWVPLSLFVLGAIVIALGAWEFLRVRREITINNWLGLARLRDTLIITVLVFLLFVMALFITGSA